MPGPLSEDGVLYDLCTRSLEERVGVTVLPLDVLSPTDLGGSNVDSKTAVPTILTITGR